MEFASIEDVKNYYVSYAKKKGFSFRMGRVTKSRTDGVEGSNKTSTLRKAITELDLLDVEETTKESVDSTFEVMPNASNNQTINLCDPPFAASKGHPRTLRTKSSLELSKKGSYNCGYCKEKGHTKVKCPSLKHGRSDIINGQLSNSKVKASGLAD
ncbi:unnamed protein product [Trifolium pratense]|uniref:Uncharacterized protein n=1 Tax=Trifolium pratense TaxID=57577 RepID=A0ACB0IL79_TRIPR|nr:unnamed protein product [Trifolium pratense]